MAIKVNLDLILVQRKVSLTDLSNKVGISITNLSVLKLNKVKAIRFSTLDAICRELKCSPGDLLEHTKE
jgi:putative transcriptional regulator|tara:strand:+ start:844 stop:1050 length:207 start_codon:yes stop_codon:yes gene_type:complete